MSPALLEQSGLGGQNAKGIFDNEQSTCFDSLLVRSDKCNWPTSLGLVVFIAGGILTKETAMIGLIVLSIVGTLVTGMALYCASQESTPSSKDEANGNPSA